MKKQVFGWCGICHGSQGDGAERRTYATRKDARQDLFDYIEFFCNPKRKHGNNGLLSPIDFEQQTIVNLQGVKLGESHSNWDEPREIIGFI